MRFRSKVDTWLAVVLLLSALMPLAAAWQVAAGGSGVAALGAIGLAALGAGLPLWMLMATDYRVSEASLDVRCGPLRWHIPRAGITRVTSTRSVLSSPALSLDRLRVEYGGGKSVLVSPQDQAGFLRALAMPAGLGGASSQSSRWAGPGL